MKRTVWLWELFGFAFVSLAGTLLHFVYEWCGEAVWAAPFSGVNESTWEHMKLLCWPMLVYWIIQAPFFRGYGSFHCVKLRGLLLGLALIPIIFYTYNGVIGKSPDFVNIAIFFISAAAAYIYETVALNNERTRCPSPRLSVTVAWIIALSFVVFSYFPPELEIFRNPLLAR